MGTWGCGVMEDDSALDVAGDYRERWNAGLTPDAIRAELVREYQEMVDDSDEGSVFWLALAQMQWESNGLEPEVLARVQEIVATGAGMDRREEADGVHERQEALDAFLEQLKTPPTTLLTSGA